MKMKRIISTILVTALVLLASLVFGKKSSSSKKSSLCNPEFFNQYHSASDLFSFLDSCADKFGAKSQTIGKSADGKSLKVLSFGNGAKEIFVMAGLHGREWIAPAATAWALYEIMTKSAEGDSKFTSFINENKIHVLALINPDGYDYSRTKSETQDRRQWRKNRRLLPCKGERCAHGVDLNRNWGIEGKTFGFGATRPTSDVFQGKRPFSEPEIRAIRDWLLENGRGKKIDFVLDIHCCAQTILPPSYYHGESASLKTEHLAIARRVSNAMTAVNQEQYGSRQREQEFSATNSGISVDWIYGEGGVGLALIVETRGNEKNRKLENIFDVDPKNIGPIGGEVLAAIFAVGKETLPDRARVTAAAVEDASPNENRENSKTGSIPHESKPVSGFLVQQPLTTEKPIIKYDISSSPDEEETTTEESAIAPLIVEPTEIVDDEPPLPMNEDEEEAPPSPEAPPPEDEPEDDIEARLAASRAKRHQKYGIDGQPNSVLERDKLTVQDDIPPNPDVDESGGEKDQSELTVNEPASSRDQNDASLAADRPQEEAAMNQEEDEDETEEENEMDAEIQTILAEVESEQDKRSPVRPAPSTVEMESQIIETDLDNVEGDDGTAEALGTERRIIKHDEGLLIIDEDEDEDVQEDQREEEETEQITKRLRARINQLRAFRQQHPQSKWAAFKAKLRKGKWRAPLAFAFGAFVLWHLATRKNRMRRDD